VILRLREATNNLGDGSGGGDDDGLSRLDGLDWLRHNHWLLAIAGLDRGNGRLGLVGHGPVVVAVVNGIGQVGVGHGGCQRRSGRSGGLDNLDFGYCFMGWWCW
jgi:hypothetical protein